MKNLAESRVPAIFGKLKNYKKAVTLLFLACLIGFPFTGPSGLVLRCAITIMIYCLLAFGNMLITGYCGLIQIGHAAFYGVGAYVSAILSVRYGVPFWMCFLAAGAFTAIVGFVIALPCLRVQSDFLSLVTLAFAQFFIALCNNWMEVTNGPIGISGIPSATLFGLNFSSQRNFYFLALAVVAAVYVLLSNLIKSKTGRAMMAIRDDELSAQAMGIDVNFYKVMSFVIGALMAGFAGSLLAHFLSYVGPTSFSVDASLLILQMCILGGLGSLKGAVFGAAFFTIMPEVIRPLAQYRLGVGGVIMLLVMLIRPQGVFGSKAFAGKGGIFSKYVRRWKSRKQQAE